MKSRPQKEKNVLIHYERRRWLLGFDDYENLKGAHEEWVTSGLENGANVRDDKWSASLAVGSKIFVEKVHSLMGVSAIGRKPRTAGKSCQLREAQAPYIDAFGRKNIEIALGNTFSWR